MNTEPTNFHFYRQYGGKWSGAEASLWVEKFCKLLAKSSEAIREVDSKTPILTNPGDPQVVHMLKQYPNAFKHINGISSHPYSVRFPPETVPFGGGRISVEDAAQVADDNHSVESLYDLLRKHTREATGRDMDVYATEFGFPSYDPSRNPGWFEGYSENAQAAYSVRALILALHAEVKTPCLYDFMNDGADPFDAEKNFGLVRHELEGCVPKPAFHAVKYLCRGLPSQAEPLSSHPFAMTFGQADQSNRYFWQDKPKEPFLRIQGPLLRVFKTEHHYLLFCWRAGRYEREVSPLHISLVLSRAVSQVQQVECQNLCTGELKTLTMHSPQKVGMDGEALVLKDLPISGDPVLISWPVNL